MHLQMLPHKLSHICIVSLPQFCLDSVFFVSVPTAPAVRHVVSQPPQTKPEQSMAKGYGHVMHPRGVLDASTFVTCTLAHSPLTAHLVTHSCSFPLLNCDPLTSHYSAFCLPSGPNTHPALHSLSYATSIFRCACTSSMPGAAIEEEAEAVAGKHGEGEAKRKNGTKTRDIVSSPTKRKVYEEPGSPSSGDDDEGEEENSEEEDVNVEEEEDEGDAEDEEDDDDEGQTDLEEGEPVDVEEDVVDVEEDGSDSEDEEEEEEEEEAPDTRHGKKQKADTTNTKVTTKAGKKAAPYRVFSSLDDVLGKGGGREKIIHKERGGFAGEKRERGKG